MLIASIEVPLVLISLGAAARSNSPHIMVAAEADAIIAVDVARAIVYLLIRVLLFIVYFMLQVSYYLFRRSNSKE